MRSQGLKAEQWPRVALMLALSFESCCRACQPEGGNRGDPPSATLEVAHLSRQDPSHLKDMLLGSLFLFNLDGSHLSICSIVHVIVFAEGVDPILKRMLSACISFFGTGSLRLEKNSSPKGGDHRALEAPERGRRHQLQEDFGLLEPPRDWLEEEGHAIW